MAKCHDNRRRKRRIHKREKSPVTAAAQQAAQFSRKSKELPPGYSFATRRYGFALYCGKWDAQGRQAHDNRIGGFETWEEMCLFAWDHAGQSPPKRCGGWFLENGSSRFSDYL